MPVRERARLQLQKARALGRLFSDANRFVSFGSWNAARLLERNADTWPHGAALLFEDQRYSWRDVDERANQWAAFFAREGIGRGDVVSLMMDNRPGFVFAETGLSKIHASSALINTHLVGKPLAHAINVARPRLALIGSEHLASVRAVSDELVVPGGIVVHRDGEDDVAGFRVVNDDVLACSPRRAAYGRTKTSDPMGYIYTSGTTGLPKAAIITNRCYQMVITGFSRLGHEAGPDDVIYVALPLYHGNGAVRWKGENVSTNEVAEVLNAAPGVLESNVYGVQVAGAEGRAGMASLTTDDGFDLDEFARYVTGTLPTYQRPYFIRLLGEMRNTATFKQLKVDYRNEGYDPAKVSDPLFYLDGDRYVAIDTGLYRRIASGELGPR